jgi:hypothetical protein
MPTKKEVSNKDYGIQVTNYYLSVYPCLKNPTQNSPSSSPPSSNPCQTDLPPDIPALALISLSGNAVSGYVKAEFRIRFYADGTHGLSAPKANGETGSMTVSMDMYYSQLAGVLSLLKDVLRNKGAACFVSFSDGPPISAEFSTMNPSRRAKSTN